MKTNLHIQKNKEDNNRFILNKLTKLFLVLFLSTSTISFAQPGALDLSFVSGTVTSTGLVASTAVQSDGKVLIGGTFTSYNGTAINGIARINTDGSLDATFNVGTGVVAVNVTKVLIQPDGKIIIVGNFGNYNGTPINRIVRLNTDGTIDPTFNVGTGANNKIYSAALQNDGKIIIVGTFTIYNGTARSRMARINSNGTIDNTFTVGTGPSDWPNDLVVQPDGKIVIVGNFLAYNGTTVNRVARINSNGVLDNLLSFNAGTAIAGINIYGYSVDLQSDGKIIIGGTFTTFNGVAKNRLVRLLTNGNTDNSFNSGGINANNIVYSVKVQPDDKILAGGLFNSFNGTPKGRIVCLNSNGTVDATFNSGGAGAAASYILSISLTSTKEIIIGGNFITYNGTTRNKLAKLLKTCINASIATLSASSTSNCGIQSTTLSIISGSLNDDTSWQWYNTGCGSGSIGTGTTITVSPSVTTIYYVRGEGGCTPSGCSTITINVNSFPTVSITPSFTTFCLGSVNILSASGASTYTWNPGNQSGSPIAINPTVTTTYTVIGTDLNGCINSASLTVIPENCVTLTQLTPAYCNSTLTVMDASTRLRCNAVFEATNYEWEFTDLSTNSIVLTKQRGFQWTDFYLTGYFPNIEYNKTYSVKIRASVGGIWGLYGPACTITTPTTELLPTKVRNDFCGVTISSLNSSTKIYCDLVLGATNYEWQFTDTSTKSIVITKQRNAQWTDFYLKGYFPTIKYNYRYSVKVRAYVNGVWGAFGTECLITTPSPGVSARFADQSVIVDEMENDVIITMYPNPTSETLNVDFDLSPENASIEVYNIIGELVLKQTLIDVNNSINTSTLSDGLYHVKIIGNNQLLSTQKIVKQ